MVICLQRGADLHMAQLMPLPLTVSCFSEIQCRKIYIKMCHNINLRQKLRCDKMILRQRPLPTGIWATLLVTDELVNGFALDFLTAIVI